MHRSPTSISSSQDTALRSRKIQRFFSFFSPYRYDKNSSYNSTLEFHIFLQNKDYLKQTCSCHRICLIQRLAQPQGLLLLSHKGLCYLRCFSHGLVVNLGKSHFSKSDQHHCYWSIFHCRTQTVYFHETPFLVGLFPLMETQLQSILLQKKKIYICGPDLQPLCNSTSESAPFVQWKGTKLLLQVPQLRVKNYYRNNKPVEAATVKNPDTDPIKPALCQTS